MESIKKFLGIRFEDQIKSRIKSCLRTFSELKTMYGVDAIYRTSDSEIVSEVSSDLGLHGVPKNRKTLRPLHEEPAIDILEPIWYSSRINDSIIYCNDDKERLEKEVKDTIAITGDGEWEKYFINRRMTKDCVTHKYVPYDETKAKGTKILFLDLNGKKYEFPKEGITRYLLNHELLELIYGFVLSLYRDHIFRMDDDTVKDHDDRNQYLGVDKDGHESFSIEEIKAAYGCNKGSKGTRWSEHYIDKFFTLELFHFMIDTLELEKELNCVIMGYFHSDVYNADMPGGEISGYMPAEFAIPYGKSIIKNYMKFIGIVANGRELVSAEKRKYVSPDESRNKKARVMSKSPGGKKNKTIKLKAKRKKTTKQQK
jgi:hypothetical protein